MKKLLLSILTITSLTAFSQWTASSIFFQGENLTYAFGKAIACDDGFNTLQHSSDDGVTWLTTGVTGVPSTGIRFGTLNGSTLYAHYNDKIYQSANGASWSLMTAATATNDVVKSMCVLNGTVFATTSPQSGSSSKIFQLVGSSWTLKATHSGTIFTVLRGIGGSLWAGTTSTLALKSTNAGTSFAASNGTLNPSAAYDKYTRSLGATPTLMFMGNDGGRIFKSTDGGNTWAPSYNSGAGSSSSVSDIFITPLNAILVACDSGFVYSVDGVTWMKNNSGLQYSGGILQDQLLAVTMSANNVIVSTKGGKVYYRSAAQLGLLGINEINSLIVESKVYPNPAMDLVTVEANDLALEKNCEVKVTDVLGRNVSVTEMKYGKAEISLNNISSGIYTYSIYNNNTVVSKGKLVVN